MPYFSLASKNAAFMEYLAELVLYVKYETIVCMLMMLTEGFHNPHLMLIDGGQKYPLEGSRQKVSYNTLYRFNVSFSWKIQCFITIVAD